MALRAEEPLQKELAGLDAHPAGGKPGRIPLRSIWGRLWPPVAAAAVAIGAWQLVVLSGWKEDYALPPPARVFAVLGEMLARGEIFGSAGATLKRALLGYSFSLVVGGSIGLLVARSKLLRTAVGSLITGLQTMPSIAWFPLAVLLFQLSEGAIFFVVVLGAAPSVANGVINGIDHVPPVLLRAGRMLGAEGVAAYRHVILPAALPSVVGGLKQAWAFSWRSLMAAELLANIGYPRPLGVQLQYARDLSDPARIIATMIVILVIGILVDSLLFGNLDRAIRRRHGLVDAAAA